MAAYVGAVFLAALVMLAATAAQIDDAGISFPDNFQEAAAHIYAKVTEPTLDTPHLQDLPGFTRSVYSRSYALVTPESQVYSALPGWANTLGAYLITPAMGAQFTLYLAKMAGNSSAAPPSKGVERLAFVVGGQAAFASAFKSATLYVDCFAYAPPSAEHKLTSAMGAAVLVLERLYVPLEGAAAPGVITGSTDKQPLLSVPGEDFELRKLLPQGAAFDFNIHIMDFQPGEYLNVKEVHYNQHGLVLLEGRGIYRLANEWYPVQAGDVIWMAPFVPQWYAALGKSRTRYFIYKDVNRDPLFHQ